MEMESCIRTFMRSLRERNFDMYLDALTEFVPWFFALDHTNYARWVPVHLKDRTNLSDTHPELPMSLMQDTLQHRRQVAYFLPLHWIKHMGK